MGNFHISIDGVGTHGQPQNQKDAAVMTRRFIEDLKNAGHSIINVRVTHGAADDLTANCRNPGQVSLKQQSGDDSPLAGQAHP